MRWHRHIPVRPLLALAALLSPAALGACDLCAISSAADEERAECPLSLLPEPPQLGGGSARPAAAGVPARTGAGDEAAVAALPGPPLPPATPPRRSRWGLSAGLILQQEDAERARSGTTDVDDPADQYLSTDTAELVLGARIGSRFGLRGYLPYIQRSYRRAIPNGVEEGSLYGPGDAIVEGTWLAFRRMGPRSTALLTVIAGAKLPTGDDSQLDQEGGPGQGQTTIGGHVHGFTGGASVTLVHPHELALGSGSYDGLFGCSGFWREGQAFATARVFYALRGEGGGSYRCANELSWGGGPGWYLLQRGGSGVGLLANLTGEVRGHDELAGQPVDDSGVAELFLGPDLSATWRGLSAEAGVDLPIYQRVDGQQLALDYRAHAGLNWSF